MKQFESGRGMVEMLGVLAIVGVLSIGGIAGYSYGIDKYHANAIVNDVNLRAVDLLSQLSQGHTPNLDSWETTSVGQYPISLNSDNAPTNYYIKVEQVPFEVCNMIADMMPENVNIFVDNDTQECGEGDNILDFEYEGFEGAQGPGDVIECPAGTSADGEGGYAGMSDGDGNRCYCENADTKWDGSVCVAQDGSCLSFSDCDKGEYCQFSPLNCGKDPAAGKCQDISLCGEKGVYEQFWMSDRVSPCKPDWWTAKDLCAAKGMRLVSLSDIGCGDYKTQTCTSDDFTAIRGAGMNYAFWTIDEYTENGASPCDAWYITSSDVTDFGDRNRYQEAVCVSG